MTTTSDPQPGFSLSGYVAAAWRFVRRYWIAALVLLVLVAGGFALFGKKKDVDPYRTAPADRGSITRVVSATGSLQPLVSANVGSLGWLPRTCAYRLLDEGKPLAWWHPLVSGRPGTVDEAGISVSHDAYSEEGISVDDLVDHIWKLPKAKRRAKL